MAGKTAENRYELWICLALVLGCVAVYAPVASYPFVGLDDELYVSGNPSIGHGLTASGVAWAFTTYYAGNWHPLTWISHMLDVQMFGMRAGGHHLTSLVIHILNSLLVFGVFRSLTSKVWRSALVAALFAVHPLHVESVAWVAERKDVLSTLFWLLTMWAYARYARGAFSLRRYAVVIAAFTLGLLAKPMLVTLPFVLLLLDYWPLAKRGGPLAARNLLEKVPLLALAAASSVVTFLAQQSGGAVQSIQNVPLQYRIANALVAYVLYPVSLVWPVNLGVYYPYPAHGRPMEHALSALVLLGAVTIYVLREARRRPYLLTGWLWYLGTMVPVIGFVQVGGQSMADRYTYVPFLGLFVMIAWGAAELAEQLPRLREGIIATVAASLLLFAATARAQVGYWSDSVTLFTRTLAVTKDNAAIHYNLGQVLGTRGRPADAIPHFEAALRLWPEFYNALINMGLALAAEGRLDEAITYDRRALAADPKSVEARVNLGSALAQRRDFDAAEPYLAEAVRLDPANAQARSNLGLVLLTKGRLPEAQLQLTEAVRLAPANAEAHNNLGLALLVSGDHRLAADEFSRALAITPDYAKARENLSRAQAAAAAGRP